jgi:hypothetical protein
MVNAQTESTQHTDGGARWVTAITSLITGTAFFALWFWLLPSWLGFQPGWGQRAGMALDRSGVLGVRFQRGAAMRVGLWMDRPRHARAGGSPEETQRASTGISSAASSTRSRTFSGVSIFGSIGSITPTKRICPGLRSPRTILSTRRAVQLNECFQDAGGRIELEPALSEVDLYTGSTGIRALAYVLSRIANQITKENIARIVGKSALRIEQTKRRCRNHSLSYRPVRIPLRGFEVSRRMNAIAKRTCRQSRELPCVSVGEGNHDAVSG